MLTARRWPVVPEIYRAFNITEPWKILLQISSVSILNYSVRLAHWGFYELVSGMYISLTHDPILAKVSS